MAVTSFIKALSLNAHHVPSMVHLAKTYIKLDKLELAEGISRSATAGKGWNCPEAWYLQWLTTGICWGRCTRRVKGSRRPRNVCGMHWSWKKPTQCVRLLLCPKNKGFID